MTRRASIRTKSSDEKVLDLGDVQSVDRHAVDYYERHYATEFSEDSLTNSQRFVRKLTFIFAFVYTNDPMSIYKGTHKKAGAYYDFHTQPRLRRGLDFLDDWKRYWRPIINLVLGYILLRYASMLTLQLLIHLTTDYSPANYRQNADQNLFKRIGGMHGHPLNDFTGISLIIYAGGLVAMGIPLGLTPYRYSIKPADAALLRFTLYPCQELCRIDLMLEQRLNRLMSTIKRIKAYKRISLDQQQVTELILRNNWLGDWNQHSNERVLGAQHQVLRLLKDRVWLLRPHLYTHEHWMDHQVQLTQLAVVIALSCVPLVLVLPPTLVVSVVNTRCRQRALTDCGPTDVLSILDMLAFGEALFGTILSGVIIVSLFLSMMLYANAQLTLVSSINKDLIGCLKLVSRINKHRSTYNEISTEEDFSVDFELTRTLVRLTASVYEAKKIASLVSEIAQDLISIVSVCFLMAMLAGKLSGLDMQILRGSLLTWMWIGINVLLTWCAYVFAKSTDNERIGWSILAQINVRSFVSRTKVDKDVIGIEWQRLIQSYSISDRKNSIRLYGMSLTFEKVLQFNFLVFSMAALLLSR